MPPKIKILEALGCIGDRRIAIEGNKARVYSSSRKKSYNVSYSPEKNAIMSNDNGSYWKGYLGYPAIAFLMAKGLLPFEQKYADALKEIAWKQINTGYKSNFEKTEKYAESLLAEKGIPEKEFSEFVEKALKQIEGLGLEMLGEKTIPPEGF